MIYDARVVWREASIPTSALNMPAEWKQASTEPKMVAAEGVVGFIFSYIKIYMTLEQPVFPHAHWS